MTGRALDKPVPALKPPRARTEVMASAMQRSVLTVLALAPLLTGCAAVAAAGVVGVGVVQYQRNQLHQDFATDLEETWKATLEALRRLQIDPGESQLGATEGRIEQGDTTVVVERHAEGFTRVRVRIGTFHSADHARRAQILLQEIGTSIEGQDELRAWAEKIKGRPAGGDGKAAEPKAAEPKSAEPKPVPPKPAPPKTVAPPKA